MTRSTLKRMMWVFVFVMYLLFLPTLYFWLRDWYTVHLLSASSSEAMSGVVCGIVGMFLFWIPIWIED